MRLIKPLLSRVNKVSINSSLRFFQQQLYYCYTGYQRFYLACDDNLRTSPKAEDTRGALRLNQNRKPRMRSLWHGYNVANFVIKFRVHNTRLSNSVLKGDRLMFSFHEYYFNIKIGNLHLL